ncbi:hypothetical protein Trydic_g9024 [Trypoxylus dichotomus]
MIAFVLLVVCCFTSLVSGGGLELPSYIPKCSISDPNLNECIKEKANIAIPKIAKGDPEFGIPSVSPLKIPVAELKSLNLAFYDAYTDDIKDIKITKASLDLKNGKIAFSAYANKLEVPIGNYTVTNLLGIPVFGHGKANITTEGVTINYKGDIELYEKDGDTYMKFANTTAEVDIKRSHYYFDNLKSPEKSDVNKYIDDNWRVLRETLQPYTDHYLNQFVNIPRLSDRLRNQQKSGINSIICTLTIFILASFIPKCSLSDPNLGDCIKEKANVAIPLVAKGVPEFGIPSVSPVLVPLGESKELHLVLNDVYTDDIKDFRLTKAYLDIKKGKAEFTLYLDRLEGIAVNYTITSGMLLGLLVSGHGKYNITMVGITVKYSSDIKTYDKGDDTYLSLANGTTSTNIERGYYYFENLQSPNEGDMNKYIDDHWQDYRFQNMFIIASMIIDSIDEPIYTTIKPYKWQVFNRISVRDDKMLLSVLLAVSCFVSFASAGGMELPSFIPKCSLSDPNLGDCIKEKANIAIPLVAKGVPEFGIATVSPLRLPLVETKKLHLVLNDMYTDDLKDFRLTKAYLDIKKGKAEFTLSLDRLMGTSADYSYTSGMLLGLPVTGHGKCNITMVEITVNYSGDIKIYDKGDDTYLSLAKGTTSTNIERGYYYFENLQSPKEGDMNKYLDDHWQDYRIQLQPTVALLNCQSNLYADHLYFGHSVWLNSDVTMKELLVLSNDVIAASFIPKCSLSDPNLGDCIKEKANVAIPLVAKGVPEFGIPSVSPAKVPSAELKELHLVVNDAHCDDLKDIRLTKAYLDIKKGKTELTLSLDRLEVLMLNYTFTSGMLLGLPVSGHGQFNMTMVGITVNYSNDIKTYDKGDDTYLSLANGSTSTSIERGYYYFENLQSPKEGDINKYIDDHWEQYRVQMKPIVEYELTKYIHTPVVKIFSQVPMDKIFLP